MFYFSDGKFCPDYKTTKRFEKAPCSSFFEKVLKGWSLDQDGSGLTNYTAKEIQSKLTQWSKYPGDKKVCQFVR